MSQIRVLSEILKTLVPLKELLDGHGETKDPFDVATAAAVVASLSPAGAD